MRSDHDNSMKASPNNAWSIPPYPLANRKGLGRKWSPSPRAEWRFSAWETHFEELKVGENRSNPAVKQWFWTALMWSIEVWRCQIARINIEKSHFSHLSLPKMAKEAEGVNTSTTAMRTRWRHLPTMLDRFFHIRWPSEKALVENLYGELQPPKLVTDTFWTKQKVLE